MTNRANFFTLERLVLVLSVVASSGMWLTARSYVLTARRLPTLVSAIVFVLATYLLVLQVIAWYRTEAAAKPSTKLKSLPGDAVTVPWYQLVALCLLFLGVAYAFGIGTGLLVVVAAASWRLGLKLRSALLYGAIFSVLIWFAFGVLLKIPLPEGALLNLF